MCILIPYSISLLFILCCRIFSELFVFCFRFWRVVSNTLIELKWIWIRVNRWCPLREPLAHNPAPHTTPRSQVTKPSLPPQIHTLMKTWLDKRRGAHSRSCVSLASKHSARQNGSRKKMSWQKNSTSSSWRRLIGQRNLIRLLHPLLRNPT